MSFIYKRFYSSPWTINLQSVIFNLKIIFVNIVFFFSISMTIWAFHFWYIDNYRECIEIKINLLFAGDVDIYRLSYSIFIPANTIDQIKPCIYIYCIFKYIVYIKKFNGKTDVNESEIIFPRNYNKWIDGTISFIISIKKEKKRKFNQDKISLIISNIYSIYIYTPLE